MKKIMKLMLLMLLLSWMNHSEAQGPPDPPENPDVGGPVGGSAPLGEGTLLLLTGAMAWGLYKLKAYRKNNSTDDEHLSD